jgi:hypothetical protein
VAGAAVQNRLAIHQEPVVLEEAAKADINRFLLLPELIIREVAVEVAVGCQ